MLLAAQNGEITTSASAERTATAQYIQDMTSDLATLARANGLDGLGYILDMARLEAEVLIHAQPEES
jgi:hypothetical protein